MVGKRMAAAALGAVAALASMAQAAPAAPAAGGVRVIVTPERTSLGKSDEVAVVVTLTNTSGATAYLLKWQTPFGAVEAPLFEVTRDGQPVPYLGRMVKRAPPAPDDYIALAPGASRSVRVELSALYRMDVTGAYSIRYCDGVLQLFGKPSSRYAPAHALAQPAGPAAAVYIAGRLPRGMAAPEPLPQGGAGLGFSQCANPQQQSITEAFKAPRRWRRKPAATCRARRGRATAAGSAPSTRRAPPPSRATSRRSGRRSRASR